LFIRVILSIYRWIMAHAGFLYNKDGRCLLEFCCFVSVAWNFFTPWRYRVLNNTLTDTLIIFGSNKKTKNGTKSKISWLPNISWKFFLALDIDTLEDTQKLLLYGFWSIFLLHDSENDIYKYNFKIQIITDWLITVKSSRVLSWCTARFS